MHAARSATARRTVVPLVVVALVGALLLAHAAGTRDRADAAVPGDTVGAVVTDAPVTGIAVAGPYVLSPAFAQDTHDYVIRCARGTNTVTLSFTGTAHAPVTLGLVESQAVVVEAPDHTDSSGPPEHYWIRCLPHDFPPITATPQNGGPGPGYYLTGNLGATADTSTYAMVLDANGTPVWYQQTAAPAGVQLGPGANRITWSPVNGPGVGATPGSGYRSYDLGDQSVTPVPSPIQPPDLHELLQLPNGDHVQIATPLRVCASNCPAWFSDPALGGQPGDGHHYVGCVIEQVAPSGALVWSWDADDHFDVHGFGETAIHSVVGPYGTSGSVADPYHCNSIDVDLSGGSARSGDVLVSMRNASALYRINRSNPSLADGRIVWKLGGTSASNPPASGVVLPDAEPVLTFAGDAQTDPTLGTISGQHDARFEPNGDVSLFDDHTAFPTGVSRGIEYHVDTTAGTATKVFEYQNPDGAKAVATGSFRRYGGAGGDNVVGWGFTTGTTQMSEVRDDGTPVMSITMPGTYRVLKVPADAVDLELLRQNTGIPRPVAAPTGDGWSPPQELTLARTTGGAAVPQGALHPVSPGPGWIDTFWKGADGQLWHAWSFDDGATWSTGSLGSGPLGGEPHAVSSAPGRIDVFWKGTDGGLWHDWFDPSVGWSGPGSLGAAGRVDSDPIPVTTGPTVIDVFWKGTDADLWHSWYFDGGGWSGPQTLRSGPLGSAPDPVSAGPGRVDVFWRGTNDDLWHSWYWPGLGWSGPGPLGSGPLGGSPHPVSSRTGVIDVFWKGTDTGLWHTFYVDGYGWLGPVTEGGQGTVATDPRPATASPGGIDVLWHDATGTSRQGRYVPGVGWSIPSPPSAATLRGEPSVVASSPGVIVAFGIALDGNPWVQSSAPGAAAAEAETGPVSVDPGWVAQI